MGRNDLVFSDEQRLAIGDALLAGQTSTEVAADAAAGRLAGLRAFQVSESHVRVIGQQARQDPNRIRERYEAVADRVLTLCEKTLDRIEAKPHKPATQDLTQLRKLVVAAKDIVTPTNVRRPARGENGNGEPEDTAGLIASLLTRPEGPEASEPPPPPETA